MRPIWSGAISFGLINIPIKLFSAVKKKSLSFHQLRKTDGCRIRMKKVCSVDGTEVNNADIVKGYEIAPENYVMVSEEELQALRSKSKNSVDIKDFIEPTQIDPVYFDHSYYVTPDKGAAKAFSILQKAMLETKKIAVAKVVMRDKEHLVVLRPYNDVIVMSTLYYADEVLDTENLDVTIKSDVDLDPREIKMAEQLVLSLVSDFNPEKYNDEYRKNLLELIEKKAEGQTISVPQAEPTGAKVIDLMAALEASIAAIKKPPKAKEKRKKVRA